MREADWLERARPLAHPLRGTDFAAAADALAQIAGACRAAGAVNYTAFAARGAWFGGYVDPADWPADLRAWARTHRPRAGECYHKCQLALVCGLGYDYWEGVVAWEPYPSPVEHAWLTPRDAEPGSRVIDLTLPDADERKLEYLSDRVPRVRRRTAKTVRDSLGRYAYLGVRIAKATVVRQLHKAHVYNPVLPRHLAAARRPRGTA